MEITAKYNGKCKECGLAIHAGDRIDWVRGNGASHVKCPEKENEKERLEYNLEKIKEDVFQSPTVEKDDDFVVKCSYHDGEYLGGYRCNASGVIETLGMGKYVSGWGVKINNSVINTLGEEFTVKEAKGFAIPMLQESFEKRQALKIKKIENQVAKFDEAVKTGKSVVLKSWSEECNDWREECDVDNVTVHANPDGTTTTYRNHTW